MVPCGSHPSVPGLLTFFFSAIGVIGVHPFRQVTDLPNAARRPQRDGAKHRSNWCKGSGKWIKGVSNLCLIHFIFCNLSSDTLERFISIAVRDLPCTFYPVLSFPTSFAVSYSSCHYLGGGKKTTSILHPPQGDRLEHRSIPEHPWLLKSRPQGR